VSFPISTLETFALPPNQFSREKREIMNGFGGDGGEVGVVKQQQQQMMSSKDGQPQYVTELRASDVLFGRGSGPNDHEGNVSFRALVLERKAEYMATNHRQTKAKIARDIVDIVYNANGRFLKKNWNQRR